MRKQKRIVMICIMVVMAALLTGCGKKKIDVMENLIVSFEGYNGYGTAKLNNEYSWETEAFEIAEIEKIDGFDTFAEALVIEGAVSYEIIPKENLSNGDEITVKAAINQSVLEEYNFELVADSELKFTVDGLDNVTKIDPFDCIEVEYDGVSSEGIATVTVAKQKQYPMDYSFIVKPSQGLKNGDTVVVSILGTNPEQDAIDNGYELICMEKEFQVEGLMFYAEKISEISDDTINQLKSQVEDIIESDVAEKNSRYAKWSSSIVYTLKSKTFLGNYFLYAKNLESAWHKNCCYFVYKLDFEGKESFSCYYVVGYYDILILEDGACSYDFDKMEKRNPIISKGMASYNGYENLDQLFNDCVTQNLTEYTYESTIND